MSVGNIDGSSSSQDVDLNLAPIIDAFTVLIAFMLMSASFLAIGIIDAGVSAAGQTKENTKPPAIQVTIFLQADHKLRVETEGQQTMKITLAAEGGAWNQAGLAAELSKLKGKWPDVKAATLAAEDTVAYEDVIIMMNTVKAAYPAVLLGGF